MNYILFDQQEIWENLLPLTFTRPISELRIGILTIKERWEKILNTTISHLTKEYLQQKYKKRITENNILINSHFLPNKKLVNKIKQLKENQILIYNNEIVAAFIGQKDAEEFYQLDYSNFETIQIEFDIDSLNYPWEIFTKNEKYIEQDFKLLTSQRESMPISPTNIVFEPERIFIEQGARVEASILNPNGGYIYIGKGAEIMENSTIRGSFAMLEHSVVKMGAKIYGPTSIGPYSKVGGEVNNSVIIGYSNKAHDGFIGNAVIGQWCNLGADTNNSNLKNNYAEVKIWNYRQNKFIKTGLQFCGLIMGDHSKSGINTMFNTGTVVGVSANIFGSGFPRNFIPSFSWGGASGFTEYKLEKALETARLVMQRRNKKLDQTEIAILSHIFEQTKKYRH